MHTHLTIATALLGLVIAGPAFSQTTNQPSGGAPPTQLSDAQCEVVWARINVAKAPAISQGQAEGALTSSNFNAADTDHDGTVSHAEFVVACNKGLVNDTASGSRAMGPPAGSEQKK
jgi:hypothetical protein